MFQVGSMGALLPMTYEIVPSKYRPAVTILHSVGWTTMLLIMCGLSYALPHWRHFYALFAALFFVCLLFRIKMKPPIPWLVGTLGADSEADQRSNADDALQILAMYMG